MFLYWIIERIIIPVAFYPFIRCLNWTLLRKRSFPTIEWQHIIRTGVPLLEGSKQLPLCHCTTVRYVCSQLQQFQAFHIFTFENCIRKYVQHPKKLNINLYLKQKPHCITHNNLINKHWSVGKSRD